MNVLVTGGAGYIGSHTVVELIAAGHTPVIVDNLCNSNRAVLARLTEITGKEISFYKIDARDEVALTKIVKDHSIDAIIHFAGLKAVGTSVSEPLDYYQNNLDSTMVVAKVAMESRVEHVVFSSSATVYGDPEVVPIPESAKLHATNPYGQTKLMGEQLLSDIASTGVFKLTILRYFNPIGAHASGLIGEDPNGKPDNLVPFVAQVAVGKRSEVVIFGDDWDTVDGTGVRDYVHVVDLARGHVAALGHASKEAVGIYNLGTGKGYSVKQVIAAFEVASGKKIPVRIGPRRPGDIAACYADATKANKELRWEAQYRLETMCTDAWRWQSKNPDGF